MAKSLRITLLVGALLLFFGRTANALEVPKYVLLTDNGVSHSYTTKANTIGEFLESQNIDIGRYDTINVGLDDEILENYKTEVIITRAIKVVIQIDSEKPQVIGISPETRVFTLLADLEKRYDKQFTTNIRKNEILTDGQVVPLVSSLNHQFTLTEYIPFDIEIIEDNSMDEGMIKIIQEGQEGRKTTVSEVKISGNDIQEDTILSETIEKEPIQKIVHKGTKPLVRPTAPAKISFSNLTSTNFDDLFGSYDSGSFSFDKEYVMKASAYTAGYESTGKSPGDPGYGVTASGMTAQRGVVAVDPTVIPLGTKLYIEGYGFAIAADTGGSINGHKIDLFYENLQDALNFGRRSVTVYVLAE